MVRQGFKMENRKTAAQLKIEGYPVHDSHNGEGKAGLHAKCSDVTSALYRLRDALAQASPHGRDYQTCPDDYPAARKAHQERCKLAQTWLDDYVAAAVDSSDLVIYDTSG